jgi:GTPase SAR1 family protein
MLWGKLIPLDKELAPVNLGDKASGFEVSLPKGLPVLKFLPYNYKGKKAIKLHYNEKEGHLKFYHKDGKKRGRHHIDNDIVSFRVVNPENEKIYCKYKYEFLEKFSENCTQPVWEAGEFKGRDDIVREIKSNFLDEINSHNYFISGMGNAGKTSLIKHLYHVAMGRDNMIKLKYAMAFIEFKKESYRSFSILENEIFEELGPVEEGRRKLIFIDEYDEIFNVFPNEFGEFLQKNDFHEGYFYVFAGRIGESLLKEMGLLNMLPHYRKFINLGSLDNVDSISSNSYEMSVCFLNDQLSEIGFPQAALSNEVKRSIVTKASGFPSLIKEILLRLLTRWSADYNMQLIDIGHVDDIVLKLKDSIRDFLFKRIYAIDEKNYQGINAVPATEVRFSEIFKRLRDDLEGESNMQKIVSQLSKYPNDYEIEKEREKSVEKKIKQLEEMGFVDIVEGKLIKLPAMVF